MAGLIQDLKKIYLKLIADGLGEDEAALERAVKGDQMGLAREIVGKREGLRWARDLFDEAIKQLDTDDDDDDDDVDELTKGDT